MPYQRGQFWIRRFHQQATALCFALASLTSVVPARDFLTRALQMLAAIGWIPAHRFLFAELRVHLLGWPRFLVPHGCRCNRLPALPSSGCTTHKACLGGKGKRGYGSPSGGLVIMDARAEKIALFRYALIAPLVLEMLPRGELTRRAEEIAARNYESDFHRLIDIPLLWKFTLRNLSV
jgi:hypothetical protein